MQDGNAIGSSLRPWVLSYNSYFIKALCAFFNQWSQSPEVSLILTL